VASLNRVILAGNLTRDPEIRYTPNGKAVGDLRLAITTKFKENEDTCFVDVTVWDRQAETCGEYLSKGSPILVEGRLKFDEWEKDGQKRNRLSVVASRVQFLGSPRGAETRDGSPRGRPEADRDEPQRGGNEPQRGGDEPQRGGNEPQKGGDEPQRGGDEPHSGGNDAQDDDNLPF